jgi:hypothetical protein
MHGQEDVGERKVEGKGKLVMAMQSHMWQLEWMSQESWRGFRYLK